MSIIQGLLEFFGFVSEKSKIEISNEYLVSGRQGRSTTLKILHAIKKALNGKDSGFKIGKTGDPAKRAKAKEYNYVYPKMYLVYKTTSKDYIKHYEAYFIENYKGISDNLLGGSAGATQSSDGNYYLYVVA